MRQGTLKATREPKRRTQKRRGKVRLETLLDIKIFYAQLINEMRSGTIERSDATAQCYVASQLMKVFELSDVEGKLNELEKRLNGHNNGHST